VQAARTIPVAATMLNFLIIDKEVNFNTDRVL